MKKLPVNNCFCFNTQKQVPFSMIKASKSRKGDGLFLSITPEMEMIDVFKSLGGILLPKGGVILPNTTLEEWKSFMEKVEGERALRIKNISNMLEHIRDTYGDEQYNWFIKRYEYKYPKYRHLNWRLDNESVNKFVEDYYTFIDWVDECMKTDLAKSTIERLEQYKELDINITWTGKVYVDGKCSSLGLGFPHLMNLFREKNGLFEGVDLEREFKELDGVVFIKKNKDELDSLLEKVKKKLGRENNLPLSYITNLLWDKTESSKEFKSQDFSDWDVSFNGDWLSVMSAVDKHDIIRMEPNEENLKIIRYFVENL